MGKLRHKSKNGIYRDYYNLQRGGMVVFKGRPSYYGQSGGGVIGLALKNLFKGGAKKVIKGIAKDVGKEVLQRGKKEFGSVINKKKSLKKALKDMVKGTLTDIAKSGFKRAMKGGKRKPKVINVTEKKCKKNDIFDQI